jgi:hypothetical protein
MSEVKQNNKINNKKSYNIASILPKPIVSITTTPTPTGPKFNIFGIVLILILIILVISFVYWLYTLYNKKDFTRITSLEAISSTVDARSLISIGGNTVPTSSYSNEYSISIWMKIDDYNYRYGQEKVILSRGIVGNGNPEIILDSNTNNLIVRVKTQTGTQNIISSNLPSTTLSNITTTTIPNTTKLEHFTSNNEKNMVLNEMYKETEMDTSYLNLINNNEVDYPTLKYNVDTSNNKYWENDTSMVVLNNKQLSRALKESFECKCPGTSVSNTSVSSTSGTRTSGTRTSVTRTSGSSTPGSNIPESNIPGSNISGSNSPIPTNYDYSQCISRPTRADGCVCYPDDSTSETVTVVSATTSPTTIDLTSSSTQPNLVNIPTSSVSNLECPPPDNRSTFITRAADGSTLICPLESFKDISKKSNDCTIIGIPLQKWINVIVSVYNQTIDVYIDGQLVSSCVLDSFPEISTSDFSITPDGGFSGQISRITFYNSAMTIEESKKMYYSGPVLSPSLFSQIPNWVYWIIAIIIILLIIGSFFM